MSSEALGDGGDYFSMLIPFMEHVLSRKKISEFRFSVQDIHQGLLNEMELELPKEVIETVLEKDDPRAIHDLRPTSVFTANTGNAQLNMLLTLVQYRIFAWKSAQNRAKKLFH